MKKIVYITGCCGFIGFHVAIKCLNLGWKVRGIDSLTYASNETCLEILKEYPNFKFENVDINNLNHLYDCDVFLNLAAETHVDNSISNSKSFVYTNINGVYNILELLRQMSYSRSLPLFFHVSTDETYGDINNGSHTESSILCPSNPYSATKASADLLILAWARTYKLPYVIVRPTNNYGLYQNSEKLIPRICKFLNVGKKIELHNKGTPIRNWLHAEDTANAIIKIIECGDKNQIYNISGGFEQSNFVTTTKVINCYLERDINQTLTDDEINNYIDFSYTRSGQDVRYSLDDSKLRRLGWSPTKIFDVELPKIVEFNKSKFTW